MTFPVDIYTEKTVEVPLHGVNFPADKALRTFPSKVQITFQVGLKRFRSIKAEDRLSLSPENEQEPAWTFLRNRYTLTYPA